MITHFKLSRICTGGLLAAAALIGTASLAMAQTVELIQNRWSPNQYITMQGNQPVVGPASTTAPSAQWNVEQTGEANVVRLRNVATGSYLVSRTGQLASSPDASADMVAASWTLSASPATPMCASAATKVAPTCTPRTGR